MLRTRVLTALVLAPAAIALIFFAPAWAFMMAVTLLMLAGSLEFRKLANLPSATGWLLFAVQTGLIALMSMNWSAIGEYAAVILWASCFTWLGLFFRLSRFNPNQETGIRYQVISFASALAAISTCWFALNWLRDQSDGEFLLLLLLVVIWAADVGAYFSGRQFGRTKLAPAISPGKTWEGVIGGIFLAGILALLLRRYAPLDTAGIWPLLLLTATTVMTSICGDLFISLHKRTVRIKDTGRLLPGHGGVLDRFDSLLPGASFFALGVLILTQ